MAHDDVGLHVDLGAPLARLTLDRPGALNALDDRIRRTFRDALTELEERPDVRVVLLDATGRAFSAGADLRATAYPPIEGDWSARRHLAGTWQRLLEQLERIPQATVVRLHGHVVGGAALLASAFDIRVASTDVRLRIPELALGIPLTWAGIPRLAREVGLPLVRDWVMTGREVRADELVRSGFVQRLSEPDELDSTVEDCVQELLAMPPAALAMTRAMTSALGRTDDRMASAWADADLQQWAFTEDEYREAVRAYVERLRR